MVCIAFCAENCNHNFREAQAVRSVGITLLSMRLMNSLCKRRSSSECECKAEASDLDAYTHAKHMKDVLVVYSIKFEEWRLCRTANVCHLNRSIVSKL